VAAVSAQGNCPFCQRIGRGEYDHADERTVAFEPLNPVTPGHLLAVPRKHFSNVLADPSRAGDVLAFAGYLANRLDIGAANFITSAGSAATQTVFHLHVHILPRFEGDGVTLPWTGQQEKDKSLALLEEAFFIRQHGERAPGGTENWRDWDLKTELYLRGRLPVPLEDQ
jgi:histidine triad (HIT) family protein